MRKYCGRQVTVCGCLKAINQVDVGVKETQSGVGVVRYGEQSRERDGILVEK